MGVLFSCVVVVAATLGAESSAADPVRLVEETPVGSVTRSTLEMKAEGSLKPADLPGSKESKPLSLKVETTLTFVERVGALDASRRVRRTMRQVEKASATINGEVRPSNATLRPDHATLVAERLDGAIRVTSTAGPLTRSELEVVQEAGDPLAVSGLLPDQPVKLGDHWIVATQAATNLTGYDALASNALEATLEALDDKTATIRLAGTVKGAALGGEGSMAFDGICLFDRKERRIAKLTLRRAETRRPGPVEDGLDIKSVLTLVRGSAEAPAPLDDEAFVIKTVQSGSTTPLLLLDLPGGKASLQHDRDWHVYWDDTQRVVLKRLNRGEMVAQLNMNVGPIAGKGRHQDLDQFKGDVRKALGDRFIKFLGEGEVNGAPAGGFRYRLSVQGRQGDAGVIWHYYLIASPEGDQLVATFTLGLAQQTQFADQDLQLIGSLEWK